VVSAKRLLLANPGDKVGSIMDTNIICVQTTADQEEVAALFRKYGLISMPVVDNEQRLVGIITIDDVVQVIQEEFTEDIEIMAALRPSEDAYLKTGILRQSRNRITWLIILMLSATVTAAIIDGYEASIAVIPILASFIPMLMNTAGISGCQSSALIIRGIALGEVRPRDVLRCLWIEVRVALMCGTALSVANFARIYFFTREPNGRDMLLSATVSLTLLATIVISKSIGCMLPLAAKKLRIDPAVMAAPILTTLADAASLVVYFTVATMILRSRFLEADVLGAAESILYAITSGGLGGAL
jgi:magnesium transporter